MAAPTTRQHIGILCVILSSICFAFVPNTAKMALDEGASLFFLLAARYAIGAMKGKGTGSIINISSRSGLVGIPGAAAYASSKAAVANFTQVMAKEVADYNITVNAVGPTPVATDLIKNVDKKKMQDLINTQAIKRLGTFEDITNVIDFFIRQESDFITGQTVYLGGIS